MFNQNRHFGNFMQGPRSDEFRRRLMQRRGRLGQVNPLQMMMRQPMQNMQQMNPSIQEAIMPQQIAPGMPVNPQQGMQQQGLNPQTQALLQDPQAQDSLMRMYQDWRQKRGNRMGAQQPQGQMQAPLSSLFNMPL